MPCVNHPEAPETARCAACQKPLCANCVITLEGRPLCGPCKAQAVRQIERGETLDAAGREPSPWEAKRSAASLFATIKQVLFSPSEFFSKLQLQGKGYWSFLILLGWPFATLGAILGHVTGLNGVQQNPNLPSGFASGLIVSSVILTPLLLLIGTIIWGAVLHLLLRLFGAANAKLETTIRTMVYAQSVLLFNWIPLAGPLVGTVWQLVILIIGLKRMHNTSYGRVIAALCIPFAVLMVMMIIGIRAILLAKQAGV